MTQAKLNKRELTGMEQCNEDKQPLKPRILKPHQSILKAYLREPVAEAELTAFRDAMRILLQRIDPAESEEFNKNLVVDLFNQSLYKGNKYMVNTRGRADLAIYSESGLPVVLFEFKGPKETGMVTKENLKNKAFYQLILYYLREEIRYQNAEIRHLIITNCWEYFIFDKKDFYQWFARNNRFAQQVLDADARGETTENIYKTIIKPEVERLERKIQFQCTYINLQDFVHDIDKADILENRQFNYAYKLFSPVHLLKQPFNSDHNTLNTGFYQELLYIMGVEEVVEDRVHKIKRLKSDRQPYSLVEQAYSKLEDYPRICGETQRFEIALGLVLTWINRVLFLKLLESQLETFNSSDAVRFLDKRHIDDYDALHDLFLKVLAKPISERSQEMKEQFPNVPYLNSSLFELSQLEETYFPISGIRKGEMNVFARTVLKDGRGKKISGKKKTLDYLLEFLDAYDFGSERNADKGLVRQESKTLINASVLGLIFEKINGYKDGSFFTPGYITQYICQETLRKAVVDKFNAAKGWQCADFEELKEHIDYGKREVRTEANEMINSLKICDPAVGSGHFLVSALNELIAIKRELGVLQDRQELPQRIRDCEVRVELDELVISNEDGENYKYDPASPVSQRIQETMFEEKRTIIENCLFGVDLNPKSVEICRLRLWIELLKSAYYYKDETGNRHLQTLPNIDINIKVGDSLLHRFDLKESISQVLSSTGHTISEYRNAVFAYKNAHNKEQKRALNDLINDIKTSLKTGISERDPKRRKLLGYRKELSDLQSQELFGSDWTAKQLAAKRKREKELSANIKELDAYIKEIESNKMYLNAFEWRIEFPEVLDDDGNFIGFDCIIGNPPYQQLSKDKSVSDNYKKYLKNTFKTSGGRLNTYIFFIHIGFDFLADNGKLSYIVPNTILTQDYYKDTRAFLLYKSKLLKVVSHKQLPFDSAVVENVTFFASKQIEEDYTIEHYINDDEAFVYDCAKRKSDFTNNQTYAFTFGTNYLIEKISINTAKLGTQCNINQAIALKGDKSLSIRYENPANSYYKLLDGRNINKYIIAWNGAYLDYNIDRIHSCKSKHIFEAKEKLLFRRVSSKLIFTYDDEQYYALNTLVVVTRKESSKCQLKYLLAILNSTLMNYYYVIRHKSTKKVFSEIQARSVSELPIKIADSNIQKQFVDIVDKILYIKEVNNDSSILETQLDMMVYKLYELTYDEVKIIDPATPITREEYER